MSLRWANWENGYIPLAKLSVIQNVSFIPLSGSVTAALGANRLMPEAALQFSGVGAAFHQKFNTPLVVSEAYRPYIRQLETWDIYQRGGNLAAYPGTSNHGWARSVDLANGIGTWSSATHVWMRDVGRTFGFFFTVSTEGWHMDYLGGASAIVPAGLPPIVLKPVVAPKPVTKKEIETMSLAYIQTLNDSTVTPTRGKIPKGWVFAIDLQNRTIRHETWIKASNLGASLNPGGKLLGMDANTAWQFAENGFKRIGW